MICNLCEQRTAYACELVSVNGLVASEQSGVSLMTSKTLDFHLRFRSAQIAEIRRDPFIFLRRILLASKKPHLLDVKR